MALNLARSALWILSATLLLTVVHGDISIENVPGIYLPYPSGTLPGKCPPQVKVGPVDGVTTLLETNRTVCDMVSAKLKKDMLYSSSSSMLMEDSVTTVLREKDFPILHAIVVAKPTNRSLCDRLWVRNRLSNKRLLNFFRPRSNLNEFGVNFKQGSNYLVFARRTVYCIYAGVETIERLEEPPPAVKPPSEPTASAAAENFSKYNSRTKMCKPLDFL